MTTLFSGNSVGKMHSGNHYYQTKDGARRWVIYAGTVEASRVPPRLARLAAPYLHESTDRRTL